MSINFGVGTLTVLRNLAFTGSAVTTGTSAVTAQNLQVAAGLVMIEGITAIVSAQSASYAAADNTGSGLLIYAYLDSTSTVTITASIGILSAAHPVNTASNIPTGICPLSKFSFGTGTNVVSTIAAWSGGSATRTIGKVQNVSINLSYENAQMRGGGDIFAVDTQFFNGAVDGSFEFTDNTATQFELFGGSYASGGAASGTWTLSGVSKPEPLSLVFQNVTNGITSTYTVLKGYLSQGANEFSRTDYMNPTWNFVGQANSKGTVLTVQA